MRRSAGRPWPGWADFAPSPDRAGRRHAERSPHRPPRTPTTSPPSPHTTAWHARPRPLLDAEQPRRGTAAGARPSRPSRLEGFDARPAGLFRGARKPPASGVRTSGTVHAAVSAPAFWAAASTVPLSPAARVRAGHCRHSALSFGLVPWRGGNGRPDVTEASRAHSTRTAYHIPCCSRGERPAATGGMDGQVHPSVHGRDEDDLVEGVTLVGLGPMRGEPVNCLRAGSRSPQRRGGQDGCRGAGAGRHRWHPRRGTTGNPPTPSQPSVPALAKTIGARRAPLMDWRPAVESAG